MKYDRTADTPRALLAQAWRTRHERPLGATAASAARAARTLTARRARRTLRRAEWELLRRRAAPPAFEIDGRRLTQLWHPHNTTWRNERAVELPVALAEVAAAGDGRVLEVGNVLARYAPGRHTVVDRFEVAPGVVNEDVLDHRPAVPYDLVVSVSTFEHVGWDDHPRDPAKGAAAVEHVRGLLAPGGRALITVPLGYNPWLDAQLAQGTLGLRRVDVLRRTALSEWVPATLAEVSGVRYGEPYEAANAVAFLWL